MSGVNRVILIGCLGADPEVKNLDSGRRLATFSIATNARWTDKITGELIERTEWHRIVAWDKRAELVEQYLSKGRQVYIEGRLQTRKWKDREGQERSTTEVVADSVTFLGSKRDNEGKEAA